MPGGWPIWPPPPSASRRWTWTRHPTWSRPSPRCSRPLSAGSCARPGGPAAQHTTRGQSCRWGEEEFCGAKRTAPAAYLSHGHSGGPDHRAGDLVGAMQFPARGATPPPATPGGGLPTATVANVVPPPPDNPTATPVPMDTPVLVVDTPVPPAETDTPAPPPRPRPTPWPRRRPPRPTPRLPHRLPRPILPPRPAVSRPMSSRRATPSPPSPTNSASPWRR